MEEKLVISSHADLLALSGKTAGTSRWRKIPQNMITAFADATDDHQWIHVNAERASQESPFGVTIAHGFLTVSLLPSLLDEIIEIRNSSMTVNYAVESLRFGTPVVVDSQVRLVLSVGEVRDLRGITRVAFGVKLEIEGEKRPAYNGTIILLYHFKN
jgi:acyl dehydratase